MKSSFFNINKINVKIINDYDYLKVINYALSKQCINPHSLVPIYLKKIDAEKKKNENYTEAKKMYQKVLQLQPNYGHVKNIVYPRLMKKMKS